MTPHQAFMELDVLPSDAGDDKEKNKRKQAELLDRVCARFRLNLDQLEDCPGEELAGYLKKIDPKLFAPPAKVKEAAVEYVQKKRFDRIHGRG